MRVHPAIPFLALLLLGRLLSASAAVPAGGGGAEDFYEDALARFAQRAYREAAIQARNALQQAPTHLPARILLGRALLRSGDPAQAEVEFEAALEAGGDPALIRPLLARAWLREHRPRRVLERLDPWGLSGQGAYEAFLLRAQAFLQMGELEKADWMYQEAAKIDAEALPPRLGRLNVQLLKGRVDKACASLDSLTSAHSEEAGVWFLAARCALARKRAEEALRDFDQALDLDPEHLTARLGRAALEVELGRLPAARQDLARLAKAMPDEPLVPWLEAAAARRLGDTEAAGKALDRAQHLLQGLDPEHVSDHPSSLLLAAAVAEARGDLKQARTWLDTYVRRMPSDRVARKRLAQVLLEQGRADEVLSLLGASLGEGDAEVLGLLGRAYLARGDTLQALDYLERAVRAGPRIELGLALAQAYLASRQPGKALAELKRIHANRPDDLGVGVRLGNLALRQGHAQDALEVARALLARHPDSREALNLMAAAELALGQPDVAFTALEQILDKAPDYLPARINLAWVRYRRGDVVGARGYLEAMLKQHPEDPRILDALGQLAEAEGHLDQAIHWRERQAAAAPDRLPPQTALADLQLRAGRVADAAALVQRLKSRWPDDLSVQLMEGRVEEAQGKPELARITYRHMTTLASYNTSWLKRIATRQERLGATEDAYWSLFKAAQGDPKDLDAQIRLGRLELALGKLDDLGARLTRLSVDHPDDARVLRLRGDLALARKDLQAAVAAYTRAFATAPDGDLAWRLYRTQARIGEVAAGLRQLRQWVAAHPEDLGTQRRLAAALIRAGRAAEAGRVYRQILQQGQSDDAGIFNNLALIALQTGDERRALEYARKAYGLAPETPQVADTLGWVLVSQGRVRKGLGYLREAQSRRAADAEIRYHIAVALERLGRRADARREIEALGKAALPGDLRRRVRELRRRLGTDGAG